MPILTSTTRLKLTVETLEDRLVPAGDPVLRWHELAMDAVKNDSYLGSSADQGGPTRTSRALAIVQAAVFDAVNSIVRSYDPYLIQVNAPSTASIDAAVAEAAHDTLVALYPHFQNTLDTALADDLAEISNTLARMQGQVVGNAVAAGILAARKNDGSKALMTHVVTGAIGTWEPDPLHPEQSALTPGWGSVTPFTMKSGSQFRSAPPPRLNSHAYTTAFNEVKNYGGDGVITPTIRTEEQTEIGIYWGYDGSPGLGTPPRLYNQIAHTIAVQQGNTVVQNSRLFAMVNLAMADAGIAAWETKYVFDFWRPVTAIRRADADGNANTTVDVEWTPLGAPASNESGTDFTPPFPAYTSGHATFGAALFKSLANFFGRDDISFSFQSDEFNGVTTDHAGNVRPAVTRSFTSFSQAAEENGQSRIYLGIHWSFDKTAGIKQGNQIADNLFRNFMKPKRENHSLFVINTRSETVYAQDAPMHNMLMKVNLPSNRTYNISQNFVVNEENAKVSHLMVKAQDQHLKPTAHGNPAFDLQMRMLATLPNRLATLFN